jgi:transcription initiation factor IIF auxiliary subunit
MEEGWGEFHINVDIFLRPQGNVRVTHYLKLNGNGPVVVNETFETVLIRSSLSSPTKAPHLPRWDEMLSMIPILRDFRAITDVNAYSGAEQAFIHTNTNLIEAKQRHVHELGGKALEKELELYTILSKG